MECACVEICRWYVDFWRSLLEAMVCAHPFRHYVSGAQCGVVSSFAAFWPLCLTILLPFLLKATNAPAALIAVPSIFVCLCVVLPYCVYIVPIITADT